MAPENTLAAFQLAVDTGADGIEFDVRLARDGVPVVIHDASLKRTARIEATVASRTSGELADIDVGSWFTTTSKTVGSRNFSSECIPTLADTLALLQDFPGLIFIELKCRKPDLELLAAAVCREVKNSCLAPQVVIKSFRLAVIPHVRALAPGVRTAALFAPKIMALLRKEKRMVKLAEELGADELSIHHSLATQKLMDKAGKSGFPVTIWTTDNPAWVPRAIRLGLRSIITNDPARMLARRADVYRQGRL